MIKEFIRLKNFWKNKKVFITGQVLTVGDGIARVYGLDNVQAGENGNYALFYSAVAGAIAGSNPWPIDNKDTLLVAEIIDQARLMNEHD